MRRTGSIISALAVALVATVGVVGGGYTIITGNTLCSLVGTCDSPTSASATPVALVDGQGSTCSAAKAVATADGPTCHQAGVKVIAVGDNADCAAACEAAKAVAASDTSTCSKSGVKVVAVGDNADCAAACEATKAVAASDTSTCSKSGVKVVAVGDNAACAAACEAAKAVAASDTSTCSKSGAKSGAKVVAVGDNADCAAACEAAKAIAASDTSTCSKSGAKVVAAADSYTCKAESMLSEEQMTARAELHEMLMPKIQNVSELSNGYSIEFPACSKTLVQVAQMVAMSRECCDFLEYSIVADSNGGAVHLVMTGNAGGKAFLSEALGPMVTQVADTGACCNADKGAKAVAASDANACPACPASKASKVIATKIDINDACCEKGIKAVQAGNDLPQCCLDKADTADLE